MKKLSFFLMAMLFSVMSFAAEVTVKISDYATANGWENSKQYKTLKMDDNVSITVAGGTNTGKYYTNGNNWRMYQNESPKITLTATNGNFLKTVKFTYTVDKSGILVDASKAQVKSGVVYTFADEVGTYTFGVSNTGTAANGQVRFTEITVVYDVPTPSNPDAVKYTVTTKVNDPAMGTVSGAGEYEEGKTATLTASANVGYKFVNWSTGSTANPLKITVTENVEVTANFEAIPPMTCAEAAATADGTTVVLKPFDVVAVVKGAGYTYIKDDSGVNLIFDYTMDDQFKAGDHVEGFVGVSSPYNGLPELKPSVAFADLTVTPGTAPEPTLFTEAPVKADVNKYVKFENVTLTANATFTTESASNATMVVNGTNVTLRNTFKLAATLSKDKTYDIVGFVAIYNSNIQVYFLSAEELVVNHTITVSANPAEAGTVTGGGEFEETDEITVKAVANEGYEFVNWTEGETVVSTEANYSFEVLADRNLVANFIKKTISYELNGGAFPKVKVPTNEELALVFKQEYAEYFAIEGLTDTDMEREVGNFIYVTNSKGGDAIKFITENANWKWLHDYILTVAGNIPEGTNVGFYWRANLDGFFHCKNAVAVGGVASADYTEAGKPEAWGAAYQAAHAVVLPTEPVDAPYTLPTPVKEGYKFVGWYDNAEGKDEPYTVIPAGWAGTLYAIWEVEGPATALDNIAIEGKVVKTIINGQLIIINNGVQYNALGQVIR